MEPNQLNRETAPDVPEPDVHNASPAIDGPRSVPRKIVLPAVVVIALAGVAVAIYLLLSGPGSTSTLAFGTGGAECTFDAKASSFPVGVPVRVAATYSPPLPAGTTVKLTVWQDGNIRPDLSASMTITADSDCVSGAIGPSAAGHYRLELASADLAPISGEFDVTP